MSTRSVRLLRVVSLISALLVGALSAWLCYAWASGETIGGVEIPAWAVLPSGLSAVLFFSLYEFAVALERKEKGLSYPRDPIEFIRSFIRFV